MSKALNSLVERVRAAREARTPLAIRGAGTKSFYGGAVKGETLDVRELSGISSYEPSELVLTARAGTPLADIEAALAERGQWLPFEPPRFPDPERPGLRGGTIGGAVAAGLSGPSRGSVGSLRDFVLGATLLNGQAVNALPDGIRLERATNTTGTNRQSYQLFPKSPTWTWSFGAGQLLDKVVIGNKTYSGSNTYDTAASVAGQTVNGLSGKQGTDRMFTYAWSSHGSKAGFSFGTGVNGGSNSSTNYLWTNASEGSPIPFTRVWIRPQIANSAAGFSPIPAGGYAASAKPATLKNKSEAAPWGVVGMNHTNEPNIEPYNTNVLTMKVFGSRTYVGGRFTGVQNGPSATPVAQQSLAAFSADGNFIDTFRPTIDGRVWDIAMTEDGKLIVAGDFTSVNGAPNTQGLAALDPETGQVVTTPDESDMLVLSASDSDAVPVGSELAEPVESSPTEVLDVTSGSGFGAQAEIEPHTRRTTAEVCGCRCFGMVTASESRPWRRGRFGRCGLRRLGRLLRLRGALPAGRAARQREPGQGGGAEGAAATARRLPAQRAAGGKGPRTRSR